MWRWESQGSWKRGGCTAREAKGCSGKQSMCAEWQWLKGQPTPITHQALAFSMHGLPLLLLTLHDKDGLCANLSPLQYFLKGLCMISGLPMSNSFYHHLETLLWGFVIEWWVCLIHIRRATSSCNKINMSFLIERWLSTTTHRCRNGMMDW